MGCSEEHEQVQRLVRGILFLGKLNSLETAEYIYMLTHARYPSQRKQPRGHGETAGEHCLCMLSYQTAACSFRDSPEGL